MIKPSPLLIRDKPTTELVELESSLRRDHGDPADSDRRRRRAWNSASPSDQSRSPSTQDQGGEPMNLIRAGREVINLDFMRHCEMCKMADDGPALSIWMAKFSDDDEGNIRFTGQEAVDVFAAIKNMAKESK